MVSPNCTSRPKPISFHLRSFASLASPAFPYRPLTSCFAFRNRSSVQDPDWDGWNPVGQAYRKCALGKPNTYSAREVAGCTGTIVASVCVCIRLRLRASSILLWSTFDLDVHAPSGSDFKTLSHSVLIPYYVPPCYGPPATGLRIKDTGSGVTARIDSCGYFSPL